MTDIPTVLFACIHNSGRSVAAQVLARRHDAGAILECWLSGQAAGGAVADLLLGVAAPSGRLAESIPVRLEDTSSFLNFPGDPGHVRVHVVRQRPRERGHEADPHRLRV